LLLLVAADIVAFAATNVDDLFVLLGFLSEPASLPRHVIAGQYLGVGAITASSLALSLVSLVIPLPWVGLIGVVPIVVGLKRAVKSAQDGNSNRSPQVPDGTRRRGGTILTVAIITALNGADNIAFYTPLFAVQTMAERAVTVVVFLAMAGLLCGIAAWLVHHPVFGPPIRRWGRPLLPAVLIGLGILVLIESGSLHLLASWRS
jgi:cadmium resistance protein CadD (predicted permease)